MKSNLFLLVLCICVSLSAFISGTSIANASVSECNYGRYNDSSTIYVSRDGSGEFNCDGIDDQVQINAAFEKLSSSGGKYTSVYLKKGTYVISAPINKIVSNSIFEGDDGAILKLKDHAGWNATRINSKNQYDPLIGSNRVAVENIEIKCFEMDINFTNNLSDTSFNCYVPGGNWSNKLTYNDNLSGCESRSADRMYGLGYYTAIYFNHSSKISVHDMYLRDGANDGVKLEFCSDVKVYDNLIYKMGHEGVFFAGGSNIDIYGNRVVDRINNAFRTQNSSNISIHDNIITSVGNDEHGSGPGIQVDSGSNVIIYRNLIYKTSGPGVYVYGAASNINIHHNVFTETGVSYAINYAAGVLSSGSGVTIENNVFDRVYQAAIYIQGGAATALNNIIVGTQQGTGGSAGSYYGIKRTGGSIVSKYNCFYQNGGGNYSSGVSNQTGDFEANPIFADISSSDPEKRDYHLQSKAGRWSGADWVADVNNSPCIDKGDPSSDFSKEKEDNGDRINMGRYGGTSQASLTGDAPQNPMPSPPEEDYYPPFETGTGSSGTGTGSSSNPSYHYYANATFLPIGDPTPVTPAITIPADEVEDLFPSPEEGLPGTATDVCTNVEGSAGFIPCGRNINDPNTDWNECAPCTLCSGVLMGQLIIEFMIKAAAVVATLALIFAGFVYIFAAGRSEVVLKAKSVISSALTGFVVIFIAWAIIDTLLITMGYIDPIEGSWHMIC